MSQGANPTITPTTDAEKLHPAKRTTLGLYVTAAQSYEMWKAAPDKVKIIDVRTPEEYAFVGHPEMAWLVPLVFASYEMKDGKLVTGAKPNPSFVEQIKGIAEPADILLVTCRSGGRGAMACNVLAMAGYTAAYSIVDGIEGGAFTARAADVGAIFYNPAGLGLSKKSSVSAASAAYEWTFYSGEVGEIGDTGSRLSNNGRLFGFVIGGEVLGDEKLSLGLAFPTPVSWKPTLQPSGIVGTGYSGAGMIYSTDGSYTDVLPTIAAGYALRPDLRIGGSLGLSFLTLSNTQEGAIQGMTPGGAALAQRVFRADGTSYDILLTGGLQWDVSQDGSRAGPAASAPTYDEREAVANVAIGGRYDLTKKTSLHLGFFTSQSPVCDESVFSVVDLYGVSTGVSLNWAHLSGSIGIVYEWGDQGIALSPSSSLPAVNGELGISSFHLFWGLTYRF